MMLQESAYSLLARQSHVHTSNLKTMTALNRDEDDDEDDDDDGTSATTRWNRNFDRFEW